MQNNLINVWQAQQKTAVTLKNSIDSLLDVSKVDNITIANDMFGRADYIANRTLLPLARLYYVVKSKELYKQANFTNFEKWAEKSRNVSRAALFQYAQIGKYVTEDGKATIFKQENGNDFDFTKLKLTIIALTIKENGKINEEKTIEQVNNVIENNIINPAMTAEELKKALKAYKDKLSGKQLNDSNIEVIEETEETQTKTETEKPETEKPETIAEKSALYKKYYPLFIEKILKALNANDETIISKIFD